MTMPNFLIIGAAKSGTTSLYHYLKQHPQIYMSAVKEPAFFAVDGTKFAFRGPWRRWASRNTITNIEAYCALFQEVRDEVAIGEASTAYLVHPRAPERIKHYIPEVKLIAILRDPVKRAYSDYLMRRLYGEPPAADLGQAIRRREACVRKNWGLGQRYVDVGFYYTHLKRYFDIFDPAQIKVHLYEDFKTDPVSILQDIFRFLGVDETFIPDLSFEYNVGGIPKHEVWRAFLTRLNLIKPALKPIIPATLRQRIANHLSNLQRRGLVKPPPLEPDVRAELIQIYREDILKLQDLIRRDLSRWLE
jgi:hypothetical protein